MKKKDWKTEQLKLNQMEFDTKNPRIPMEIREKGKKGIFDYLKHKEDAPQGF